VTSRRPVVTLRGKNTGLLSVCCGSAEAGKRSGGIFGQSLDGRDFSDAWLDAYLAGTGPYADADRRYKLEKEGVALFSGVDGDYFTVLGLPLLDLLFLLCSERTILTHDGYSFRCHNSAGWRHPVRNRRIPSGQYLARVIWLKTYGLAAFTFRWMSSRGIGRGMQSATKADIFLNTRGGCVSRASTLQCP